MSKVVTLGEIMLRLSTEDNLRITQSNSFRADFGGGEANVAVGLANFGIKTEYVTKLPKNALTDSIFRYLKANNVITDNIVIGGERLGTYYLEVGTSVRASSVIYDRKYSAFSGFNYSELDIETVLKDCKIIHLSGITPALSRNCEELIEKVMKKAKEMNVLVSFDFNYRSKLWSLEEASESFKKYLSYVDICFAGALDAQNILKLEKGLTLKEYYEKIFKLYPNIKYLLSTKRETHSVNENSLTGYIYKEGEFKTSTTFRFDIVDRVGGGDAFATGALFGIYNNLALEEIVEFATASSVYKHTIKGDANIATTEEIYNIIKNGISTVSR